MITVIEKQRRLSYGIGLLKSACDNQISIEIENNSVDCGFNSNQLPPEQMYLYYKKLYTIFNTECFAFPAHVKTITFCIDDEFALYFFSLFEKNQFYLDILDMLKSIIDSDKKLFPQTVKYLELVSIIEK